VTLRPDSVEVQGVLFRRAARREDVHGWRLMGTGSASALRLEMKPGAGRALTFPSYIVYDDHIDQWLRGAVNLAAQEQRQSLEAVLADPDLPGSSEEKLGALRGARRVGGWHFWACLGAALWLWWYPVPYELAIVVAAVLPWVAVALAGWRPSLYRLDGKTHEVGVLLIGHWFPMIVLALRAFRDVEVLDLRELLTSSVVLAATCVGVTLLFVRQARLGAQPWLLAVTFLAYSYGVVTLANRQLDGDAMQVIPTQVLAMRSGDPRQLILRSWGPADSPTEIAVSRQVYENVRPGDRICVHVWPGALGMRWFAVGGCPE
jgi:hypothetical protein